nr:unnamed protein product [Callosobruchus analis]
MFVKLMTLERPEEPCDPKGPYKRLQEQNQKRKLEYEGSNKLKNLIKYLDDDEVKYLDLVDRLQNIILRCYKKNPLRSDYSQKL